MISRAQTVAGFRRRATTPDPGHNCSSPLASDQGWTVDRYGSSGHHARVTRATSADQGGARAPSSDEFLHALVDSTPAGIALLDETGRYSWANRATYALLGSSPAELLGTPCRLLSATENDRKAPTQTTLELAGAARTFVVRAFPLAGTCAWGIEFRDVSESLEQGRRVDAFVAATSALAFAEDLGRSLDTLAEEVRKATGLETCTIFVAGDVPHTYQAVGGAGFPADLAERIETAVTLGANPFTLTARERREPVLFRDFRQQILQDSRWRSVWDYVEQFPWNTYLALPLIVRGEPIGALAGFLASDDDPTEEDMAFLTAMAEQAAVAIDSARLFESARLLALEEERARLAEALHDSVAQTLFSLSLHLGTAAALAGGSASEPAITDELRTARALAADAAAQVRELLSRAVRKDPTADGLLPALRKKAREMTVDTSVAVEVVCDADLTRLPPDLAHDVYKIVLEALTNAWKHSGASHVLVRISPRAESSLEIVIGDNGRGFGDEPVPEGHVGLLTMQVRVERLGGSLQLRNGPGGCGAEVEALLPVPVSVVAS
ncbi:MAG: hypothetical protein JWM64_971 [Frankiales bacterium]|nr:hypothetical protein [Frankiales bacterium]